MTLFSITKIKIWVLCGIVFLAAFVTTAQNKPQCVAEVEQATAAAEKTKDYSQALVKANECVRKAPKSIDALFARAKVRTSKGEFDLALADLGKAIELDAKSADAYHWRAMTYWAKYKKEYPKKESFPLAMADFDKAIEKDPKKGESYLRRAVMKRESMGSGYLALMPEFNKAIELLTGGKDPVALASAYYERGHAYGLDRRSDLAVADYTTALQIKPDYSAALLMRATTHGLNFKFGDRSQASYDAAVADYTLYLKVEPPTASTYISRGSLYEDKFDRAKAVDDYRAAFAIDPNNGWLKEKFSQMGISPTPPSATPVPTPVTKTGPTAEEFAAEGRRQIFGKNYDAGIKALSECVRLMPDAAACFAFRGYAYGMKGDMTLANADHAAAVKLNPKEVAIYFVRGMMFVELGKKVDAATEFRNMLKLDPNNQQAQKALQSLGVNPN
ncbi:MAG: tetratricopeptide repeat protein [Pyrinomonadaceae bacterium]|nr:tetratricopeptide repeat protein [Pyrinomonadaceae bacterium]MBP6212289.1 tetratricopeptide repeat protein [Pyrinomonadaceae bacterium]